MCSLFNCGQYFKCRYVLFSSKIVKIWFAYILDLSIDVLISLYIKKNSSLLHINHVIKYDVKIMHIFCMNCFSLYLYLIYSISLCGREGNQTEFLCVDSLICLNFSHVSTLLARIMPFGWLTHISMAFFLWDIGKQNSPR